MMATCHSRLPGPGTVYIKGVPEAVLRLCQGEGNAALLAAGSAAEEMAGRALRVFAVARVDAFALDATTVGAIEQGRVVCGNLKNVANIQSAERAPPGSQPATAAARATGPVFSEAVIGP